MAIARLKRSAAALASARIPETERSVARGRLRAWFQRCQRELPWRRTRDPWAIWVSEVMCQQTRVDSAIPYYERFMRLYPTTADLAAAPVDELLSLWSGLGYYSRARNLHRAATQVMRDHGGRIPCTESEFRALPGVGAYTAGAVLSIAFEQPVPAVDGNVRRVLSRLEDLAAPTNRQLTVIADSWIDRRAPGEWTQALMELGALLCKPIAPECDACPLREECRARRHGTVAERPEPRRPPKVKEVHLWAFWDETAAGLVLERRPDQGIWGGLWMVPLLARESAAAPFDPRRAAAAGISLQCAAQPLPAVIHLLTHRRILLHPLRVRLAQPWPAEWERVSGEALSRRGTPTSLARIGRAAKAQMDREWLAAPQEKSVG